MGHVFVNLYLIFENYVKIGRYGTSYISPVWARRLTADGVIPSRDVTRAAVRPNFLAAQYKVNSGPGRDWES